MAEQCEDYSLSLNTLDLVLQDWVKAVAWTLNRLDCVLQSWVKAIAKTGFGLANTGVSATIGRANKVLLHGEAISLPPGLVGLPRNLSALPANIRDAIPDIIAR